MALLRGRVPEEHKLDLEKIVATDANSSVEYASEVINSRFELGEPAIATDTDLKWLYLRMFPDAIDTGLFLLNDIDDEDEDNILTFAISQTKRNKPLSDDVKEVIDDSPYLSYAYAIFGVGGRYPDGETAMQRVPELYRDYKSQMEIDK